ncbi:hypothetical protein EJB05_57091, partial [Eragrostis curvula]
MEMGGYSGERRWEIPIPIKLEQRIPIREASRLRHDRLQLEEDFAFHFAWGKEWRARQCGQDFLMQFPNKERLQELINFPELKLRGSGASVEVLPWTSQARAKARLHTVWVSVDNVPEELLNYHAVCEIGSMLGAVEQVDMEALEDREEVRFKVDVKSVSKIPPVLEIAVKPFIYDIYFTVEAVVEEGWNAEGETNPGKRYAVEPIKEAAVEQDRDSKRHKASTAGQTSLSNKTHERGRIQNGDR